MCLLRVQLTYGATSMVFTIMMDSAKNYCSSVLRRLQGYYANPRHIKNDLLHAGHDAGSGAVNLAMHYLKPYTHPYIEKKFLDGKSLNKIRHIADTAKEGNFSPLIQLIRRLMEERLGDNEATVQVDAYLERVKNAATGCLLVHQAQIPTSPLGLGDALSEKFAIVCVAGQFYLVEKESNGDQRITIYVDDPANQEKHEAFIRVNKFFHGLRLGKAKLAEVHELKALNDAFGLNIISALERVIRDYIPSFRKLKLNQYVKDELQKSDLQMNGALVLYSQKKTDPSHLSQIKKMINALFLIQRGLERCERLPVNFARLDDVD